MTVRPTPLSLPEVLLPGRSPARGDSVGESWGNNRSLGKFGNASRGVAFPVLEGR